MNWKFTELEIEFTQYEPIIKETNHIHISLFLGFLIDISRIINWMNSTKTELY